MPARKRGKSPSKSAQKTAVGKPFAAGVDERRGRGPAPGAPNAGRPRDVIREAYLQGAERALPKLLAHLDSDDETVVQGASEKFLKYGLGSLKGVLADTVVEKVRETLDVVRANTTPEQYQVIAGQLRPIWS